MFFLLFFAFVAYAAAEERGLASGCEILDYKTRECIYPERDCSASPMRADHTAWCAEYASRTELLREMQHTKQGSTLLHIYLAIPSQEWRDYARHTLGYISGFPRRSMPELLSGLDHGTIVGQEGRYYAAKMGVFSEALKLAWEKGRAQ